MRLCVCKPCISILYLSLVMSRELWQRPLWHSVCSCAVMRNNIFLNNTVSWLINNMFQGLGGHAGLMFALENLHVPVMYQKYRDPSPNISWELHLDTVFMTLTDSCRGNADDPGLLLSHWQLLSVNKTSFICRYLKSAWNQYRFYFLNVCWSYCEQFVMHKCIFDQIWI